MRPERPRPPIHRSRWVSLAQMMKSATAHWAHTTLREAPDERVLARRAGVGDRLEQLDDERVVEVGDVADRQLRDVAQELGGELLGDDDVVRAQGAVQDVEVLLRGVQQGDAVVRRSRSAAAPRA